MCSYDCCKTTSKIAASIEDSAKTLKLLGEPNRLRVMCVLNNNSEHCVCEFEDHMPDVSQSLLSHHLADLKEGGLVISEKRGQRVYYQLTPYGKSAISQILNIQSEELK